jgi:hypothetical protein
MAKNDPSLSIRSLGKTAQHGSAEIKPVSKSDFFGVIKLMTPWFRIRIGFAFFCVLGFFSLIILLTKKS